jgi:hypothetical protein
LYLFCKNWISWEVGELVVVGDDRLLCGARGGGRERGSLLERLEQREAAARGAGSPFTLDGEVTGRLPVAYRDVVEVLVDAGVPLRDMQICQALGLGDQGRHRESMRSKLKRLVRRGWLIEAEPGLFAAASGVAGVLAPDSGR